jgi:hypothetical protein
MEDLCDHLMSTRIFTLIMNKIFIRVLTIMKQMATDMIGFANHLAITCCDCVFHILREVDAEGKVSE